MTAAQEGTRAALATSDANLADALVAQARSALVDGSTAVAAVLASHAVALGPAPEAWGVLSATAVASRAQRLDDRPLTGCGNPLVLGPDDVLCLGDTGVTRVHGGVSERVVSGPSVAARRVQDTVYVQRATGETVRYDPATGPTEGDWMFFRLNGGTPWPIRAAEWHLESSDLPLNRLTELLCPGVGPATGATLIDDKQYAVLCLDGSVGAGAPGEVPRAYAASRVSRESMSGVIAAELAPGGRYLVVGGTKGKVAVIDVKTGEDTTVQGEPGAAWLLSISPDGSRVAVGGDRTDVEVRTLPGLEPVARIPIAALSARFAPDGTLVLASAAGLTRWTLPATRAPTQLRGPDGVTAAQFSPHGLTLATAHGQLEAILWDLASGARRATLPIGAQTAKSVAFTLDGSTAWFAMTGGGVGPVHPTALRLDGAPPPVIGDDLMKSTRLPDLPPGFQSRRVLVLRPGVLIALGYARDPNLLVVDTTSQALAELSGCPAVEWFDAGQSPAGELGVLVADAGQVVRISRGETLRCEPPVHVEGASCADVDAVGDIVVGVDSSEVVRLDPDGAVRWRAPYPGGRILDVAISADGRWVAAGGTDHQARLWDATGALRAIFAAHTERVASVDFRPDGRMLATGSWDGTARLWNLDVLGADPAALDAAAADTWGLTLAQALSAGGL